MKEYVRPVAETGVAWAANVCGNPKLQRAVLSEARQIASDKELTASEVAEFKQQFEKAARPANLSPNLKLVKPSASVARAKPDPMAGWKV